MGVSGLADLVLQDATLAEAMARRTDGRSPLWTSPRRARCARSWSRGSSTPAAPCSPSPRPSARPRTWSRRSAACSTRTRSPLPGVGDAAARAAVAAQRHRRPPARRAAPARAPRRRRRHRSAARSSSRRSARCCSRRCSGLADLEPVELAVGDEVDLDDVVRRLAGAAYHRVDLVERRGEFAVRGGIVDVFPPTEEHPLRVEFWGDDGRGDPVVRRRRPAHARGGRPAVGAAVPRAAAHRRGAGAGPRELRRGAPRARARC